MNMGYLNIERMVIYWVSYLKAAVEPDLGQAAIGAVAVPPPQLRQLLSLHCLQLLGAPPLGLRVIVGAEAVVEPDADARPVAGVHEPLHHVAAPAHPGGRGHAGDIPLKSVFPEAPANRSLGSPVGSSCKTWVSASLWEALF